MKVYAILNNYQLGGYVYKVLASHIVDEIRIDPKHTKVIWGNMSSSDINLLGKALGGQWRVKSMSD